ncbi:TAXI family TRAP transporter solute-binding subunit [Rhodospirillum sp. A1_3_36]|uniref:TAXI family TRAP transporter solute-binding subunit n=1 Tax=Rhodospirillum sp. A1_3_36 TaxID=3391666 RepID=UPI0039A743BE
MSKTRMNTAMTRRALLARLSGWSAVALAAGAAWTGGQGFTPARAQELNFLRIGTGRTSGAYFPVGGLIGTLVSNPPGSRPCDRGGSCGVPGVIAVAQSTGGSVDNLAGLGSGQLDLAICQADVAYGAYRGVAEGEGVGVPAFDGLRAIGTLYRESLHLVARADSGITGLQNIAGKRVSLGDVGSGTLVSTRLLLETMGLGEAGVQANYDQPNIAADKVARGELDAFFFFGGAPVALVSELRQRVDVSVLPVEGEGVERLAQSSPYLTIGLIETGLYDNPLPIPTLQVGAVLVTTLKMDDALVKALTAALWAPQNRILFEQGPPQTRLANALAATQGHAVPLHPGALRYYRSVGILGRSGPMTP